MPFRWALNLNVDLNNFNLNDFNFDENDLLFMSDLWLGIIDLNNAKHLKEI